MSEFWFYFVLSNKSALFGRLPASTRKRNKRKERNKKDSRPWFLKFKIKNQTYVVKLFTPCPIPVTCYSTNVVISVNSYYSILFLTLQSSIMLCTAKVENYHISNFTNNREFLVFPVTFCPCRLCFYFLRRFVTTEDVNIIVISYSQPLFQVKFNFCTPQKYYTSAL